MDKGKRSEPEAKQKQKESREKESASKKKGGWPRTFKSEHTT